MKTVVIYTEGTLGDHLPFISLGQSLTARGYQVFLAINGAMHAFARKAGLSATSLGDIARGPEQAQANAWAWDHWNHPTTTVHPNAKSIHPSEFVAQARRLVELCRGADLLITTSIRTLGYITHGVLGLPWITMSMNPYSFWVPGNLETRQRVKIQHLKKHQSQQDLLELTFKALGTSKVGLPWHPGWMFGPNTLLASSRHFSVHDPRQLQPHGTLDQTGFLFYEDPNWVQWQPDDALKRFCDRRPLVMSLSSQPLENRRELLKLHVRAAEQLGLPLLVQRGWAGFSDQDLPADTDPSQIFFTGFIPQDWLFSKALCAIQHGGIGSIARALHEGCPLLIEPFGNDQLYNATQIVALGAGAALHPFHATPEILARTIEEKVLGPSCRTRSEEIGALIRQEQGLDRACDLIERYWRRQTFGLGRLHSVTVERNSSENGSFSQAPRHTSNKHHKVNPPVEKTPVIPKILHQTWKNMSVPDDFATMQETWTKHHPGWEYRLWTDYDNRELIRQHHPWFLPIYDQYPESIMRVDAARYFILHHFGGVYADLDLECLKPVDPLLTGRQLVFGLEPTSHLRAAQAQQRSMDQIVSNAWMASVRGHAFWEYLFRQLVGNHIFPSVSDATGSFFLTRAIESYPDSKTIRLQPAENLYPIDRDHSWQELPEAERTKKAKSAFTVHHWLYSWGPHEKAESQTAQAYLIQQAETLGTWTVNLDRAIWLLRRKGVLPRISCLMITRNRSPLALRALHCFLRQSYPAKELIIIDDGTEDVLERAVQQYGDPAVRYLRQPDEGQPLGQLRNLAVSHATGDYLAQWDDDDLSDPRRLELQMAVLQSLNADACLLHRTQIWWPASRRLAYSCVRHWEGSALCSREHLTSYPELRKGEDSPVIEHVIRRGRTVLLDLPQLYTYVFHGGNTFQTSHWEEHWRKATETFEGLRYDIRLEDLQKQTQWKLTDIQEEDPSTTVEATPHRATMHEPKPDLPIGANVDDSRRLIPGSKIPRILILLPVKDGVRFLPRLWENLKSLTFPHERISLAFLESDSLDGTFEFLERSLPRFEEEFERTLLFKTDFGFRSSSSTGAREEQFRSRSMLARCRNLLLSYALVDQDWVLWMDVGICSWPPDVIEQLLAPEKDIVTPNCLVEGSRASFDLNSFRFKPGAENLDWKSHMIDDLIISPKGFGRMYLSDLRAFDCVTLDAVGGSMLLIRADLHRQGLIFPPFSYRHYIDTCGLAMMAQDMGWRCWGLPQLEISQAPV